MLEANAETEPFGEHAECFVAARPTICGDYEVTLAMKLETRVGGSSMALPSGSSRSNKRQC